MAQSRKTQLSKPAETKDAEFQWPAVVKRRVTYEPATAIYVQGAPARNVLFVEAGTVRLSVVSRSGKEALIAFVETGHFFGEGCLAGQPMRMATAVAMDACTILAIEKQEMVRQLRAQPAFFDRFLLHMLTKNIRIEEDLVDHLFNSSEKRLARAAAARALR
jgi:CRP-like cAMP-binding protein